MHFIMALAVAGTPVVAQIYGEAGLKEKRGQRFILSVEPRLTIHRSAMVEQDCTFDHSLCYDFISARDMEKC